jgi:hypothetical protein
VLPVIEFALPDRNEETESDGSESAPNTKVGGSCNRSSRTGNVPIMHPLMNKSEFKQHFHEALAQVPEDALLDLSAHGVIPFERDGKTVLTIRISGTSVGYDQFHKAS